MKDKVYLTILLITLTILHALVTRSVDMAPRYEVVSLNEMNYVIIDNKENKIYHKYVSPNSGPNEFRELELPE